MTGAGALWSMSDNDLSDMLLQLWASEQAIAARRLRVVREIDGRNLARRQGATSAAVWLRDKLRVTFHTARRMLSLAAALDGPCQATAAALEAGVVNEAQANVIADAVTGLPDHGPIVQAKAETVLLHPTSAALEPASLKVAAAHVLEHVDPQLAGDKQRRDLEAVDNAPPETGRSR